MNQTQTLFKKLDSFKSPFDAELDPNLSFDEHIKQAVAHHRDEQAITMALSKLAESFNAGIQDKTATAVITYAVLKYPVICSSLSLLAEHLSKATLTDGHTISPALLEGVNIMHRLLNHPMRSMSACAPLYALCSKDADALKYQLDVGFASKENNHLIALATAKAFLFTFDSVEKINYLFINIYSAVSDIAMSNMLPPVECVKVHRIMHTANNLTH